jgi:phosphoglycerate dehydrogenase-like enzyme
MNDLKQALKQGRPGQAAIDVFDIEPLPENDSLRTTEGLLLTPHLGFVAQPVFENFSKGIIDTLEAWLNQKPLPYPYEP